MNINNGCRLCLKASNVNYKTIQANDRDILNSLPININLDVTKNPLICNTCMENLKRCIDFKSLCIHTENKIINFLKLYKLSKTNMEQVYLNQVNNLNLTDVKKICRYCMMPSENFYSLNKINEDANFTDLFQKYLPEVSLNVINDPICCTDCLNFLNIYFDFLKIWQETEQYIKIYCNSENLINKAKLDFNNIGESFLKVKSEYGFKIENTELNIKEEIDDKTIWSQALLESNSLALCNDLKCIKNETDIRDLLLPNQDEMYESNLSENSYVITDYVFSTNHRMMSAETLETPQHNINLKLASKRNFKSCVKFHKDTKKLAMYKCADCSYETKKKSTIEQHIVYKHMDASQLQMYKCTSCTYEAKTKSALNRHIIFKHKDSSEIKIYKCVDCPYEAKMKSDYEKHIIYKHTDVSELQMYKCTNCNYEGKTKSSLSRHITYKHKNSTDIKMFKCTNCPYKAKMKSDFKKHVTNKHTYPNEVKIYKCADCSYIAKRKYNLNQHIIYKHTDCSELHMYKCDYCIYEAKTKGDFKRHIINKHNNSSDLQMYKCPSCSYKTKYKDKLHKHKHTDASELQIYMCANCAFKTNRKETLTRHIMCKHMSSGETKIYKCDICSFETNRNDSLNRHLKRHGHSSGPQM